MTEPTANESVRETVFDSISEGIFAVDNQMRITMFNRAAEELTGIAATEAIGKKCHDVISSSACTSICPLREALECGNTVANREVEIISRDCGSTSVLISASAIRSRTGEVLGGVVTFRNFSEIRAWKKEIRGKYCFHGIASRNGQMHHLFDLLPDIAASEATVLLNGESGTGKELFARAVHDLSGRAKHPLVIVNCGALPEQLLEAEIFGSKRGAYTGAIEDRPGRLEMAEGGTLFLDEIGDLPIPLQVKLLRVLENREYQPLGAKYPKKANVRFIAATHRNLERMVEEGKFRQDLYFRINVISLKIPALRQRPEDVPLLLDLAIDQFNGKYSKRIRRFSADALEALIKYQYPGNVRELLNIVEQAVILCRDEEIDVAHLPAHLGEFEPEDVPSRRSIRNERLTEALARHGGNRTRVAKELGVDRSTLWRWLKQAENAKHFSILCIPRQSMLDGAHHLYHVFFNGSFHENFNASYHLLESLGMLP